jgi:hypothetical protein
MNSVFKLTLGPVLALALAAGLLSVAPSSAQAQPNLDFAILDCQITDGPTADLLDLVLTMGVLTPDEGSWQMPVSIYYNGLLVEPYHNMAVTKVRGTPCPSSGPCPANTPPCGKTVWSFKGVGPITDNWPCVTRPTTNICGCVPVGTPVAHKIIPRPATTDSFFDVFVDLGNLFPETDENNNHCRVHYAGPVPAQGRSWGSIKHDYYR